MGKAHVADLDFPGGASLLLMKNWALIIKRPEERL